MTKYSLEKKLAVVNDYLEGTISLRDTAKKHNVSFTMVQKWVTKYQEHGNAAFNQRYTNYPIEFKMDVLKYINESGASLEEVTSIFNIPSSSTVWTWKSLYETHGIDALLSKTKGRPSMKKEITKKVESTEETLRAENERLRMENAYLKKLHALIQEKEKANSPNGKKHK